MAMKNLRSYQTKILLSFLALGVLLISWILFHSVIKKKESELKTLLTEITNLQKDYLIKSQYLQNFLLYGYHQSSFYTHRSQKDLDSFKLYIQQDFKRMENLANQAKEKNLNLHIPLKNLSVENQKLAFFVNDLENIYYVKGFKDFGIEGQMRYYAHFLEDSTTIAKAEILQLRRHEKDFLLRGEPKYASEFLKLIDVIIANHKESPKVKNALDQYKRNFQILEAYNNKIGIYSTEGLYSNIQVQTDHLLSAYARLSAAARIEIDVYKNKMELLLYIGSASFLLIVFFLGWRLSIFLTKEIKELNNIVLKFIKKGLKEKSINEEFDPKILEVDILNRSFKLLKKKLALVLAEKENYQKKLVKAVIEGQERERKYIGAELHDNINQMLTAAKLYTSMALEQEVMRELMLEKTKKILENTIREVRILSHALVGPKSDELLLEESLRNLLNTVSTSASLKINFSWNDFDENKVAENKKMALYRIAQEQMNNVVKYAKAQHVFVSVTEVEKKLHLSIKDDGVGFDPDKKKKGIGFRNIQSRLALVNGKMYLNTYPGKGCELQVSIPLEQLT